MQITYPNFQNINFVYNNMYIKTVYTRKRIYVF